MSLFALLGFLVFLLGVLWLATYISSRMQAATFKDSFARGQVPNPQLNGFYKGTSHILFGMPLPWLGKRFSVSPEGGLNVFSAAGGRVLHVFTPRYKHFTTQRDGTVLAYSFTSSVGASVRDAQKQVLRLDYNVPENPGLARIFYNELVEIDPGRFLGQEFVQALPGWFLRLGFFELKETAQTESLPVASPVATAPVQARSSETVAPLYPPTQPPVSTPTVENVVAPTVSAPTLVHPEAVPHAPPVATSNS
jgi:hypothetical protein